MKNILPFENIIYTTYLSENEVYNKINEIVNIQKNYTGKWANGRFKIKRNINYRNSFLPQIQGELGNEWDKTRIKVKMKLHPFVLTFIIFWLSGVLMACIVTTYMMTTTKGFDAFFLIPYIMFVIGCVLTIGAFKVESSKSRKDLQQLFEAEIVGR